jgi:hypothetical protein
MDEQLETAWKLEGISPRAYQHPADRAATAALQKVPYLDQVVRTLVSLGYERALRAFSLGSSVRLGQQQLPHVWVLQRQVFNALDMERVPDLYMTQRPVANAYTIARRTPSSCSTPSWSGSSTTTAAAWCSRTRRHTCTRTMCSTRPR